MKALAALMIMAYVYTLFMAPIPQSEEKAITASGSVNDFQMTDPGNGTYEIALHLENTGEETIRFDKVKATIGADVGDFEGGDTGPFDAAKDRNYLIPPGASWSATFRSSAIRPETVAEWEKYGNPCMRLEFFDGYEKKFILTGHLPLLEKLQGNSSQVLDLRLR